MALLDRRRFLTAGFLVATLPMFLMLPTGIAEAHPLPDTRLVFSLVENSLNIEIDAPLLELRHALPELSVTEVSVTAGQQKLISDYFLSHLQVTSEAGAVVAFKLLEVKQLKAEDDEVGQYTLLRLKMAADLSDGFDGRAFKLRYDAIMHKVPNHAAQIFWKNENVEPMQIGEVRYDVFKKTVADVMMSKPE